MSKMSRYPHDAKVYVGELGNNASKQDIEEAFGYYGPLRNVWVARNPPGFAFVEFEDARDAEDAVRGLDGRTISGRRARVELSTGRGGRGGGGGRGGPPRGGGKGGRFQSDDRCYECGGRGHFARDCARSGRRGRKRSRSPRSRSRELRTRSRSYSRSRSRSRDRRSRSKATPKRGAAANNRSLSRDVSKTPRRNVSRSPSRSKSRSIRRSLSRSQSRSVSRSRSRHRNGDH
ncbi:serine/arginine-rich splicing factor 7 isoform X1 [Anopheles arabiensis]|nr:serine/arginine-rich splicing factor 7 isoform X1 [Anopheles arabiensis]XP_040231692.1 serine/arginine-rich splicing factor 7 isoform X1 [Anopheles coluzzii]XP_041775610.1 serine/arginine-rich splicing factor 7 isoform X1 [Anopheles merus]XP_061512248.1 serine/arginine-rich splicing factor 7 isoform X1 [Anopheles gambiae]